MLSTLTVGHELEATQRFPSTKVGPCSPRVRSRRIAFGSAVETKCYAKRWSNTFLQPSGQAPEGYRPGRNRMRAQNTSGAAMGGNRNENGTGLSASSASGGTRTRRVEGRPLSQK